MKNKKTDCVKSTKRQNSKAKAKNTSEQIKSVKNCGR